MIGCYDNYDNGVRDNNNDSNDSGCCNSEGGGRGGDGEC